MSASPFSDGSVSDEMFEELQRQGFSEKDAKGLVLIRHSNSFVDDVLNQAHRGEELTENQREAVLENLEKIREKYGAVEDWKELRDVDHSLRTVLELLDDEGKIAGFWSGDGENDGHTTAARDFLKQLQSARYLPALTENQRSYAVSILERYDSVKRFFARERNYVSEFADPVRDAVTWSDGVILLHRTEDALQSHRSGETVWRDWEPCREVRYESREAAEQDREKLLEQTSDLDTESEYKIVSVEEFYPGGE